MKGWFGGKIRGEKESLWKVPFCLLKVVLLFVQKYVIIRVMLGAVL